MKCAHCDRELDPAEDIYGNCNLCGQIICGNGTTEELTCPKHDEVCPAFKEQEPKK